MRKDFEVEALAMVAGERRILDDHDRRVRLAEHPLRQGWIGRRRRPIAKAKTRDRRRDQDAYLADYGRAGLGQMKRAEWRPTHLAPELPASHRNRHLGSANAHVQGHMRLVPPRRQGRHLCLR